MSANTLPPSYSLIHNALAPHTDHSVILYTSRDRVAFDPHPSPIYGYHAINDLSTVLPDLNAQYVIQVSNAYTKLTVDLATCPQGEVCLGSGLSLRVVDGPQNLIGLQLYEPVIMRSDGSLVVWGDNENDVLRFFIEAIADIQNLSWSPIPTTTPVAGPPGNDMWASTSLANLDELSFLFTHQDDGLPTWGANPALQGYYEALESAHHPSSSQRTLSAEPSQGSLSHVLPLRAPSPFSDATTTSSVINSPPMADLEGVFSSFAPSVYVGEDDFNLSLDFSFDIDDQIVSSILSSSHSTVSEQASNGSSSSYRHTVVETCTSGPFRHGIDQNATHEDEEAGHQFPQPSNSSTFDAAIIPENASVDLRSASTARGLKRSHSAIETDFATTRLATPLPDVEYLQPEVNKRPKFLAIALAPAPPPTPSASASTRTPTSASASSAPSPSPSIPTPASGSSQRRPPNRRRNGGGPKTGKNARGKRHSCEYCSKTFSRLQDQQRHMTNSCDASPIRSTVECPECNAILSRLDAAQRHWRGHENPSCPAPDWVSGR